MSFVRFYQPYFPASQESEKENGFAIGYYLVRESDSKRFFISKIVDVRALEKIASEVLSEASGYGYWVDRSMGKAVDGSPAWMNRDFTDRFF
jgi:hypothetical protein